MKKLALLLSLCVSLGVSPALATETTRATLQAQNSSAITPNGAGQISATTLSGLLANIIDSAGVLQSNNSWTGQNTFAKIAPTSRGQCSMTLGTCGAIAFPSTYSVAPTCFISWTGVGTLNGKLKITANLTTTTPASSDAADTAQVNWVCFGN